MTLLSSIHIKMFWFKKNIFHNLDCVFIVDGVSGILLLPQRNRQNAYCWIPVNTNTLLSLPLSFMHKHFCRSLPLAQLCSDGASGFKNK